MNHKPGYLIAGVRKSQGLSQEELAEKAALNLRTIQRIESGATTPRGFTLRAIADALGRPVLDFSTQTEETDEQKHIVPASSDQGFLIAVNLVALSFWIFPFLNVLTPLIVWSLKSDKAAADRSYGAKLINFQITWSILIYVPNLLVVLTKITHTYMIVNFNLIFMASVTMYIANTCFILLNTFLLSRDIRKTWFFALPLIR